MTQHHCAGYSRAVVTRGNRVICRATVCGDGRTLYGVAFDDPAYQKSNRTRQAAMRAYQAAGYR